METIFRTERVNYKNIIQYPDISIKGERITFICGESGSGKSSLLKLLNGTEKPEQGRVFYQEKDIAEMDTVKLRRQVSLVGQSVYLFDKTIKENFEAYYEYRDLTALSTLRMNEFLRLCCADFSMSDNCRSLSGGERQRVYLAIFLSLCPDVLMLDEPTSALDQSTGFAVMDNICTFCKEKKTTLLVVSHDANLVGHFAEDKIVLEKGNGYGTDR